MVSAKPLADDTVIPFVRKAIGIGAMEIEVEYESGREHVFAVGGHIGVEIASLKSSGKQARALREALYRISKRPRKVIISGSEYALKVQIYESFGEDAYRVTIKKV